MKSRLKKEINNLLAHKNYIVFSKENLFSEGDIVTFDMQQKDFDIATLENDVWMENKHYQTDRDIFDSFAYSVDNYLLRGKSKFVYILKPVKNGYLVVKQEHVSEWIDDYWMEADPNNERDWAYIDEDINDLYTHLLKEYCLSLDNKYKKRMSRFL